MASLHRLSIKIKNAALQRFLHQTIQSKYIPHRREPYKIYNTMPFQS